MIIEGSLRRWRSLIGDPQAGGDGPGVEYPAGRILDFIGFELMRLKDLGENLGIEDKDLDEQISILEKALLVERYKDCCELTPDVWPCCISAIVTSGEDSITSVEDNRSPFTLVDPIFRDLSFFFR